MRAAYDNKSQQRVLRLMLLLFGHEVHGIAPSQLARATGEQASTITRDVHNLIAAGVAERVAGSDHVRISPALGRKAIQMLATLDAAEQRLADVRRRFTDGVAL